MGGARRYGGSWSVSVLRTLRWQRGDLLVEPSLKMHTSSGDPNVPDGTRTVGINPLHTGVLRVQIGNRELVFKLTTVRRDPHP
eukprot:1721440-Prymnesium_polylepis.1